MHGHRPACPQRGSGLLLVRTGKTAVLATDGGRQVPTPGRGDGSTQSGSMRFHGTGPSFTNSAGGLGRHGPCAAPPDGATSPHRRAHRQATCLSSG